MSTNQLNLLSESELLEAQPGYTIHGEPSRRVSSRDDSRHAHTGLLRYKGLYVTLSLLEINIVCSNQLVHVCTAQFSVMAPLSRWVVNVLSGSDDYC